MYALNNVYVILNKYINGLGILISMLNLVLI